MASILIGSVEIATVVVHSKLKDQIITKCKSSTDEDDLDSQKLDTCKFKCLRVVSLFDSLLIILSL